MDIINQYENTLRDIIVVALQNKFKEHWEQHYGVTEEKLEKWRTKREEEIRKRKGLNLENRLIYYSEFYDLAVIIDKKWQDTFSEILIDKKRFEVLHKIVEDSRNTIAHSRPLLGFEKKMLEAIVDDFKTKIVLYNSINNKPENFFIQILKVYDNYGTVYDITRKTEWFWKKEKKLIRVGEKLEFTIEAFDPQDRKLVYSISNKLISIIDKSESNHLSFIITNNMIGNDSSFIISVNPTEGYEEHSLISFEYTIVPNKALKIGTVGLAANTTPYQISSEADHSKDFSSDRYTNKQSWWRKFIGI